MTFWQKAPEDHKDMWHWLGIAISLAQTIGLQLSPATMSPSLGAQNLRRRIWRCYVIRDSLIALGTRQSIIINDDAFDDPMLQNSEFDIGVYFPIKTGYKYIDGILSMAYLALLLLIKPLPASGEGKEFMQYYELWRDLIIQYSQKYITQFPGPVKSCVYCICSYPTICLFTFFLPP